MIKRVLMIGLCIVSMMVCDGCGKGKSGKSSELASSVVSETVPSSGRVEKTDVDKILSVEQKEIYEEYEGHTIVKMYAKMTSDAGINIRKGPGETYERLAGLAEGEVINVIGQCEENGWYMILHSGGIGFVSNEFVSDEADLDNLVLGDECPRYLYVKTEYQGQVGWFYRSDIGWQCENYDQVIREIVEEGYGVEHFPVYVGTWRDVGDVMWIGYTKE